MSYDTKQAVVKWSIDELKPYPKQQAVFSQPSDDEIKELAASIKLRGLDYAIEILPDGTILKGHRRWLACTLLGWTEMPVIVRNDLEGDAARAEYEFLDDNCSRRQSTRMERVRCYIALYALYHQNFMKWFDPKDISPSHRVEFRAMLAQRLGESEKTVGRYLAVAKAPPEVQTAFDNGELRLELAARVGNLPAEQQDKIAKAIQDGEHPQDAVERVLRQVKVTKSKKTAETLAYLELCKALEQAQESLRGRAAEVRSDRDGRPGRLALIQETRHLLDELEDREGILQKESDEACERLGDQVVALFAERAGKTRSVERADDGSRIPGDRGK